MAMSFWNGNRFAMALAALIAPSGCAAASPAPSPGSAPAPGSVSPAATFLTPYGPPTRPFSPAVRVGNMLYLSGQIGTNANASGPLVEGGIEAETKQTMENIKE